MHNELTVDSLAQEIRRVDGSHSLGAGALAEALMPFLSALVDVQAVEPVAWRWESAYGGEDLIGQWQVSTVKPSRSEDATDFICEPLYASPPIPREGEDSAEVKDAHETVQKLCDMHGTLLRILDEKVGLKVFMANEVSSLASLLLDAATKLDRVNRATLAATRSGSATGHSGGQP